MWTPPRSAGGVLSLAAVGAACNGWLGTLWLRFELSILARNLMRDRQTPSMPKRAKVRASVSAMA